MTEKLVQNVKLFFYGRNRQLDFQIFTIIKIGVFRRIYAMHCNMKMHVF